MDQMSSYIIVKFLHILSAFALVGPLILTPRWLYLARHEVGQSALKDLHRLTGISGWILLISGGVMLFLQDGGMLFSLWMQLAIALFIAIQIFDHFWADRREDEMENNPDAPVKSLKIWLIVKLAIYTLITLLMVVKPVF